MSLTKDLQTVKDLIDLFLHDNVIRNKLRSICISKRNDWEKWLQLELEFFINSLSGYTVEREIQALPDKRKMKKRLNMFVDFAIRKKHTKKNSYIFIELKCSTNPQALINGFNRDIDKICAIKECIFDTRSFWCVGFHKNCTNKSVEKVIDFVNEWNGHHEVIYLCNCSNPATCDCKDNKIGLAIL
ncbi:hypothetical protein [Pantoea agglomerans]|uniref:hypothetical protein n=1 Tax=Enterobacter agglomerans TaxID=549 RepID=UPI0015C5B9D8|nr:hypothetical protein [Pantoea agglomerans]NYB31533.1 hypothetical protein [Pantoea agglomerans]